MYYWRPFIVGRLALALATRGAVALADPTADELVAAMRSNDRLLQQCVLDGVVVQKILPSPPRRPIVLSKILVGDREVLQVGRVGPAPATHRPYRFELAQFDGDVAVRLYGGDRDQDALTLAFQTLGNRKRSLEYFAGTWERVDDNSDFPVNGVHEAALWYNFALGVGFGERVQSATLKSKRHNHYVLEAKFSIWPGKTHDARLVVDESGLVREADIDCDYQQVRSTSSGAQTIPDACTRIAASGSMELTIGGKRVQRDQSVALTGVRAGVTKAEFAALCDMSVSDGRPVYYQKDGYQSERVLISGGDEAAK